ncbi:hypothetical protein KW801_03830 [Candidatus Saccharibacteria bacterium]|nr:hypothetical protein [Candidatus Saccharibacteria bacterium]
MKILKKIITKVSLMLAMVLASITLVAPMALAATTKTPVDPNVNCNDSSQSGLQNCIKSNKIVEDLNGIIDFLSAGVAIVVIGSIILGGIQYSMAGGSPEAVTKARQRITNGLIAFAAFLFIFAFLQWIIPGGI